jgi:tRNA threonylcarbamoyladenosine modification (KEOPS) complex  Pcc1 subunit
MSALGDISADMSQAAHIDAAGSSALATRSTLQVLRMSKSEVTLAISADDLCILNNAMNEALEALGGDEDEFRTRMGTSRAHVERLLESVNALLQQM